MLITTASNHNLQPLFHRNTNRKTTNETILFPLSVLYSGYSAFNQTVAHLTTNSRQSLYIVPPTCFGLNMAFLRKVLNKEIQQWLILLKTWIYRVKIQCFLLKLQNMFKILTNYLCSSYIYFTFHVDICLSLLTDIDMIMSLSFLGSYPCVFSRC